MTGIVAQVAALISHGNQFLETGEIKSFYPANSSFEFCNRVDFRLLTHKRFFIGSSVSTIAEDPVEWFRYLHETGCDRLRFQYLHSSGQDGDDDFNLAGFAGGGGEWLIEAVYGNKCVLWRSFWDVTVKEAKDQKIWSITYGTDGTRTNQRSSQIDLANAVATLSDSLNDVIRFATSVGLSGWNATFEKSLDVLKSDDPEADYYHKDLLAGSISIDKRRLFYAAAHAWVFGGMGAWNDNWFEAEDVQTEYQRVTANLFDAVNEAYGSVLND